MSLWLTLVLLTALFAVGSAQIFPGNRFGNNHPGNNNPGNNNPKDFLDKDSLTWVETGGLIILDTSVYRDMYLLDSDLDGTPDFMLNFGPRWIQPDSTLKPRNGDSVIIKGYLHTRFKNIRWDEVEKAIEVVELNGTVLRDTTNWHQDSCSHVFNQGKGRKIKDLYGGQGKCLILPTDTLQSFKGVVLVDSTFLKNTVLYLLDTDADSEADYLLGFGRRKPDTTKVYPAEGDNVTIDGVLRLETRCGLDLPLIIVVNLNGASWNVFPGKSTTSCGKTRPKLQALCYPNPFNPSVTISFTLEEPTLTEVVIYNIFGEKVKTINQSYHDAGQYRYQWNGDNETGSPVSAGTYFSVIKTDQQRVSQKIIFLK